VTDHGSAPDDLLTGLRRAERSFERFQRSHRALSAELRHVRVELSKSRQRIAELETAPMSLLIRRLRLEADRLTPPGTFRRAVARAVVGQARRRIHEHLAPCGREETASLVAVVPVVPVMPMAVQPEVSIVIPVHNQWPRTAACLCSIVADISSVGYEVVLVDDASTDETPHILPTVGGIRVVRLDENQGFLGATNAGIAAARGRFVVLLNNDTEVQPGWLDALVTTAESDERIGVVGAKLVYPDGTLQEAGGIIWSDGSGHNYGRDQDPDDPRYGFVREVDYCSGACLLVRADLLAMLGGLDERYRPAYYEDTDLCFAARKLGFRVLYQPEAVVVHHEGASHGTDPAAGVKRYQEINREKFVEKWAETLSAHGVPDYEHVRQASWRRSSGHCLVVDHALPMPDFDSGSRRMSELLGILDNMGFAVTFVPQNGVDIPRYRQALTSRGIEVLPSPADLDGYIRGVLPDLRLIILSRPTVAWANYPMMRSLAPDALLVYDTVDLHHVRERRRAIAEDNPWAATRSADYHYGMERSLMDLVDQVWVVSEPEAEALRSIDPATDVAVVPNIHRPEPPGPSFFSREGIVFVGNYAHDPNRDAAKWLATDIVPRIRRVLGDVPVSLVGSHMSPDIEALRDEGVSVLGWVPMLDALYHRARVFVAPLRYGAGMKGKVGEACAYGLPVVSTSVGVEGMDLRDGEDVLVADDPDAFAAAVVTAYTDAELWSRLATNGRRVVGELLSVQKVQADLTHTLKSRGLAVIEP